MKALKFFFVMLIGASLAACGNTTPLAQTAEPTAANPYNYVLDGQPVSLESLERLSAQGVPLNYFVPTNWDGTTMQVYSTEAGLKAAQAQQDQKLKVQGWCVSLRTKSQFFDGENYTGADFKVAKGITYADLTSVIINGRYWDEDISSVKAADCTYTYLYDWVNPNITISPGQNLPALPYPYNTGPGKSTILGLAVL